MKRHLYFPMLCVLFTVLSGCNNFGKEKIFDGVELYHTKKVTDAEANRLGNYLISQKFADGQTKTVQLTKSGNTYQFRMVVKEGIDKDPEFAKTAKLFASMLSSEVFNGAPVELHLCDDHLKTLKILVADDYGNAKFFDGVGIFHTSNITDAQVDSLGSYLVSSKFADGNEKSVLITKSGDTYQFKMVVKSGVDKDTAYLKNAEVFASQLSAAVFNGAVTELHMCDNKFNTLVVVQMNDATKKM